MKKILCLTLCAIALFSLTACGSSDSDDSGDNPNENTVSMRFVNASPDTSLLDFWVQPRRMLTNQSYLTPSDYLTVGNGPQAVGASLPRSSSILGSTTAAIFSHALYTSVAYNKQEALQIQVLSYDPSDPPLVGEAWLRVMHAATAVQELDLYLLEDDDSLESSSPILSNLSFGEATVFIAFPRGNYRAVLTRTGTKTVRLDSGSRSYSSRSVTTMIAANTSSAGLTLTSLFLNEG